MDKEINTLSRLDVHYWNLPVSKKRELIGSIFPEKIVFDGINYRTPKVNEAARLIYMINSDLYSTKNRKGHKSVYLPVKWNRRESNLSSETCIYTDVFYFSKVDCPEFAPKFF